MSFSSDTRVLPKAPNAFILFAYDWNYSHDGERDCQQAFPTLREAEQAYQGTQDAAEVAIIEDGSLRVISRGFANRRVVPQQIQWSRSVEWAHDSDARM